MTVCVYVDLQLVLDDDCESHFRDLLRLRPDTSRFRLYILGLTIVTSLLSGA